MSGPREPEGADEFCCCGCGQPVEGDDFARVEGADSEGIPILMVYASAECAAKHDEGE